MAKTNLNAFSRLNLSELNKLNSKYLSGYRFIKRDQILDQLATIMEQSGLSRREMAHRAGLSVSTLRSWTHGKTNRPQNATTEALLRGLGYARQIVLLEDIKE